MIVAVPSKGRAGSTTTDKVLPNSVFFVPESEIHQYEYITNVVAVPSKVKGITATRNWILENCDETRVVFVDDDVKACGYIKLHERRAEHVKITEESFWINEFMKLFDITEQIQYKIWGIKTESAPRSVYPYKPLNFKSYITASCMGIINDGEYLFDERYPVKEDYEICLRHIQDKGGILSAKYIYWENSHWDDDGGCKDYRTVEMEKRCINQLIEQYPGRISSVKTKENVFTIKLNL